jgi:hypothetical protein
MVVSSGEAGKSSTAAWQASRRVWFWKSRFGCWTWLPAARPGKQDQGGIRLAQKSSPWPSDRVGMERNHQGKGNVIRFPASPPSEEAHGDAITCRERLDSLLKYYSRAV